MENDFITHIQTAILANIHQEDIFKDFLGIFTKLLHEKEELATSLLTGPNRDTTIGRYKSIIMPEMLKVFEIAQDDIKSRYIFEFYLSGIISVFSYWIASETKLSEEQLGEMIKTILMNGILPQIKSEN